MVIYPYFSSGVEHRNQFQKTVYYILINIFIYVASSKVLKTGAYTFANCSNPQVLIQNLTLFKTLRSDSIIYDMPTNITTEQIDQRMRVQVKALRIERQLIVDPLEQQYLDKFNVLISEYPLVQEELVHL
ncbi:Hypothetical_protein [Hexamita inflata]|uniref:Hypothetical_protein n=1 Tax=Hexamita inflata TaxID=28002 RepID=A0AA86V5A2_9EUKA|nr:Hypothetical protein HINF_LOCUS64621 [Hexamita inflata]